MTHLRIGTAHFYIRPTPHHLSQNIPLCTCTPHSPCDTSKTFPLVIGRTTEGFYFLWLTSLKILRNKLRFPWKKTFKTKPKFADLFTEIKQRLRWSRGSVLAFGTQVRGFKPGRSRRIFQGEKILSTPSFGREVKPFVPCRRFTACKRSLNVGGSRAFSGKIHRPFLP